MQEFISCLSQQMTQAQTPPPSPDASGRALVPLARRAAPDHPPRMNANRRK